jgi:hypothetical protein
VCIVHGKVTQYTIRARDRRLRVYHHRISGDGYVHYLLYTRRAHYVRLGGGGDRVVLWLDIASSTDHAMLAGGRASFQSLEKQNVKKGCGQLSH